MTDIQIHSTSILFMICASSLSYIIIACRQARYERKYGNSVGPLTGSFFIAHEKSLFFIHFCVISRSIWNWWMFGDACKTGMKID